MCPGKISTNWSDRKTQIILSNLSSLVACKCSSIQITLENLSAGNTMMHILLFPAVKRPIIPEIKSYFMILANFEVSSKWFALRSCCDHQARDSQLARRGGSPHFWTNSSTVLWLYTDYPNTTYIDWIVLWRIYGKNPSQVGNPHIRFSRARFRHVCTIDMNGIAPDIDAISIWFHYRYYRYLYYR